MSQIGLGVIVSLLWVDVSSYKTSWNVTYVGNKLMMSLNGIFGVSMNEIPEFILINTPMSDL